MPFVAVYFVNFSNGNLHPQLNTRSWPDMAYADQAPDPNDVVERIPDPSGLVMRITRNSTAASAGTSKTNVFVVPANLSLDGRIMTRVTFDLPLAESVNAQVPHLPTPWALGLPISPTADILSGEAVNVTCNFNASAGGVRLNTLAAIQTDPAAVLESPLDYSRYQGGYVTLPDGTGCVAPPPAFTLDHFFSGRGVTVAKCSAGFGVLQISRTWMAPARDHRVYTSKKLAPQAGPSFFGALGAGIGTTDASGRIRARLLDFSVWINDEPPP